MTVHLARSAAGLGFCGYNGVFGHNYTFDPTRRTAGFAANERHKPGSGRPMMADRCCNRCGAPAETWDARGIRWCWVCLNTARDEARREDQ